MNDKKEPLTIEVAELVVLTILAFCENRNLGDKNLSYFSES